MKKIIEAAELANMQSQPNRGELSRRILEHTSKRTMHRIEKMMTCKYICADDKCEDGKLCHPERCKKWEYNTNLDNYRK